MQFLNLLPLLSTLLPLTTATCFHFGTQGTDGPVKWSNQLAAGSEASNQCSGILYHAYNMQEKKEITIPYGTGKGAGCVYFSVVRIAGTPDTFELDPSECYDGLVPQVMDCNPFGGQGNAGNFQYT